MAPALHARIRAAQRCLSARGPCYRAGTLRVLGCDHKRLGESPPRSEAFACVLPAKLHDEGLRLLTPLPPPPRWFGPRASTDDPAVAALLDQVAPARTWQD